MSYQDTLREINFIIAITKNNSGILQKRQGNLGNYNLKIIFVKSLIKKQQFTWNMTNDRGLNTHDGQIIWYIGRACVFLKGKVREYNWLTIQFQQKQLSFVEDLVISVITYNANPPSFTQVVLLLSRSMKNMKYFNLNSSVFFLYILIYFLTPVKARVSMMNISQSVYP